MLLMMQLSSLKSGLIWSSGNTKLPIKGGAVAEWSKALQLKEKIDEKQKIIGTPPPGQPFKKDSYRVSCVTKMTYLNL